MLKILPCSDIFIRMCLKRKHFHISGTTNHLREKNTHFVIFVRGHNSDCLSADLHSARSSRRRSRNMKEEFEAWKKYTLFQFVRCRREVYRGMKAGKAVKGWIGSHASILKSLERLGWTKNTESLRARWICRGEKYEGYERKGGKTIFCGCRVYLSSTGG